MFAASKNVSCLDAAQALAELGELKLLPKRIWRSAKRIGEERIVEQQAAAAAYQELPLPARQLSPAAHHRRVAARTAPSGVLGYPEKNETGTPRVQLASTLTYLTNQQGRMQYHEYRRQGLPITSSHIESTIKQINRRIKGTEKFWDQCADPMLHFVADILSQSNVIGSYWERRTNAIVFSPCYHQAG